MRTLDEIITRRALDAIAKSQQNAEAEGRSLTEAQIAGRMAEFMDTKPHSTVKQLRRYLGLELKKDGEKAFWRTDYIEAFCQSVGVLPQELLSLDPDDGVSEATHAQFLVASLSPRLGAKGMRRLATTINQILDDKPTYDLGVSLLDILGKYGSKNETLGALLGLVDKSRSFDGNRKSHRGKPTKDKKSSKRP